MPKLWTVQCISGKVLEALEGQESAQMNDGRPSRELAQERFPEILLSKLEEIEGFWTWRDWNWRDLSPAIVQNLAFSLFPLDCYVFTRFGLGTLPILGSPGNFEKMDSIGPDSEINLFVKGTS